MRYKKVIFYFCCSLNGKEVLLMPSSSLRSIVLYHQTRKQTRSCGCRWLQAAFQSGYFLKPWTLTRMFSTRRQQNVDISFILLGEDLRICFKSKERLCVLACVRVRECYNILGWFSNRTGTSVWRRESARRGLNTTFGTQFAALPLVKLVVWFASAVGRPVTRNLCGGVLTRPKWTQLPKCIFYFLIRLFRKVAIHEKL